MTRQPLFLKNRSTVERKRRMKRWKRHQRRQKGFTPVEIIVVMIVLGVIAAFAMPKFFTIANETRDKALSDAVAELKGRVHQYFSSQRSQGGDAKAIEYSPATIDMNLGGNFTATITSNPRENPITGVVTINDGSGRAMDWGMDRPGN